MILAVDDEAYASAYVEELQWAGFTVEVSRGVDAAAKFVEANVGSIEMCILDLMLPPGELFSHEDTLFGRRTGFLLYDYLRHRHPRLPIIILTNVNASDVDAKFDGDRFCWTFLKYETLPYEVVSQVETVLGRTSEEGEKE